MTAVRIKGYTSELLVKEKTLLRRRSSSKVVHDEGNQYVDLPIRMDVRDEPTPSDFEDHEYESVRRLSSETALSVSMESLVSNSFMEMKVSAQLFVLNKELPSLCILKSHNYWQPSFSMFVGIILQSSSVPTISHYGQSKQNSTTL